MCKCVKLFQTDENVQHFQLGRLLGMWIFMCWVGLWKWEGGLVYLCWVLLWFCLVRLNLVDEVIRLNSKGNAIRYSNLRIPFCNHRKF